MQIRTSRREQSPKLQTAVAVSDVGGRPAGGVWNFKGHRDGQ